MILRNSNCNLTSSFGVLEQMWAVKHTVLTNTILQLIKLGKEEHGPSIYSVLDSCLDFI